MSWVEGNLQNALDTWNEKLSEIYTLVTQSPSEFREGAIWEIILNINGALQAIVLACIIFSAFATTSPTVDTSAAAVTMVWEYIGELIFNMLVLVGTIRLSDRIVKEMMGL